MTDLEKSPSLQRWSRQGAGFFLGGLIGLFATIVVWRIVTGGVAIPSLARTDWEQARHKWEQAKVANYDVEVVVTGLQAATYAVQVREGQAVRATRNGQPLPQRRTWSTWTVDGMFETIARDLEAVERRTEGRAESTAPQLQLRAAFHPNLGYPQQYIRTEMTRSGANREVTWKVVRLESREQRAESREQRAGSREQRAESRKQGALSSILYPLSSIL